ncbi:hypothetical protein Tco_1384898 [Tanacetum coccineum]
MMSQSRSFELDSEPNNMFHVQYLVYFAVVSTSDAPTILNDDSRNWSDAGVPLQSASRCCFVPLWYHMQSQWCVWQKREIVIRERIGKKLERMGWFVGISHCPRSWCMFETYNAIPKTVNFVQDDMVNKSIWLVTTHLPSEGL